jgi:hypothetical protein
LTLKELRYLLPLHLHSVNHAAILVHARRVLSSAIIKSCQEPVLGQACNTPDPHWSFYSFGGGVLGCPVPNWLLYLNKCGEWFFFHCLVYLFSFFHCER